MKKGIEKHTTDDFKQIMDNVNKFSDSHSKTDILCAICHEAIDGSLKRLKCKHKFHAKCIKKWYESSNSKKCPLCQTINGDSGSKK